MRSLRSSDEPFRAARDTLVESKKSSARSDMFDGLAGDESGGDVIGGDDAVDVVLALSSETMDRSDDCTR